MARDEYTCVVDAKNKCGEGPLWHPGEQSLYWTDVNGFTVQRFRPADGDVQTWHFGEPACSISLTTDPERLLVALGSQLVLWHPATDARERLAQPETRLPSHRLNDGATDPGGAFWVGSMPNNVAPDGTPQPYDGFTGNLYRVTSDGEVTTWDRGFGIYNTLAWSPDRRVFYGGDSVANVIYAYDYDEAAQGIGNRRDFLRGFERGSPDGSAIDADGFLWNCRFGGACIVRVAPGGAVDRIVELPVSNPTNCAFGGPDLRTLYVTSAALETGPGESPLAGGVFAVDVDVAGLDTFAFRLATRDA
jgi:sugar lactone lactonase YvrE